MPMFIPEEGTKQEEQKVSCPQDVRLCSGCGRNINDRYYLSAVDKHWHVACLKCTDCGQVFESETSCFTKDGAIFCREDYYRRFGRRHCAQCGELIAASELVMRAREFVYHTTCFVCHKCTCPLNPGDQFGMKGDNIYCKTHYELLLQEAQYFSQLAEPPAMSCGMSANPKGPIPEHPSSGRTPMGLGFMNGGSGLPGLPPAAAGPGAMSGTTTTKGRPRKRKAHLQQQHLGVPTSANMQEMRQAHLEVDMTGFSYEVDGHDGYNSNCQRQKRMRTSFKHSQLRTMKSYFSLNHNPDAKDLKTLAQKTGLSKRVLQVWFQNARAKYRRHMATGGRGDTAAVQSDELASQGCYPGELNISSPTLDSSMEGPLLSAEEYSPNSSNHVPSNLSEVSSSPTLSDICPMNDSLRGCGSAIGSGPQPSLCGDLLGTSMSQAQQNSAMLASLRQSGIGSGTMHDGGAAGLLSNAMTATIC